MPMDTYLHTIIIFADITTNPEDRVVAVGTKVTLTCGASGADNLKYQWMRMGKETISSRARGIKKNTLIISNIMVEDNGEYYCVISSGDTTVISRTGTVSVLSKLLTVSVMYFHACTMHYHEEHPFHNFSSRYES